MLLVPNICTNGGWTKRVCLVPTLRRPVILTWSCPCCPTPPSLHDMRGSDCRRTHKASHHPLLESGLPQRESTSDYNEIRGERLVKERSCSPLHLWTHPMSCFPKVARFNLNLVGCKKHPQVSAFEAATFHGDKRTLNLPDWRLATTSR